MRGAVFIPVSLSIALATAAAGATGKVKISLDDCRRISVHVAQDDVAFRPGVGARGEAVAPADLGGTSAVKAPESFSIDITDLLGDRVEVPAAPGRYVPEARMGKVVVTDGKLTYNGQELGDSEAEAIAEACRRTLP